MFSVSLSPIQLHVENHKKLLRRKNESCDPKMNENHNFQFSVCFLIPECNFRPSNVFLMFFNMKLNRAKSQKLLNLNKLIAP